MITERRKQRWQKLENTIKLVQNTKASSLSDATLRELGVLYRQVSIDLSLLRSENVDPAVLDYLNNLLTKAHSLIYSIRRGNIRSIWWFLKGGFASVVRNNFIFIGIASLIFLCTILASFLAVKFNPKLSYSLFNEEVIQYEEYRLERQEGEYKGNFTFSLPASSLVAAFIITNNLKVDIYTFAGGILYCLPCVLILIINGLMLGTFSGVMYNYGYSFDFYSLILTHGVWELTAMCLSGGAGLMLGYALISPGEYSRRDALKLRAGDALQILAGAALMTTITGLVESYVTPHTSLTVRWLVIIIATVSLILYFTFAGRKANIGNSTTLPDVKVPNTY